MTTLRTTGFARAMTLVEVMVSLVLFAIAILGSFGLLAMSTRTMDTSRAFTQVTQILTHEMEAMRLRSFDSAAAGNGQRSITYLANNIANYSSFTPFADYRNGDMPPGTAQPALGADVLKGTTLQLRNATGFTCTRKVVLNGAGDSAEITLTVSWTDAQKMTHSRSINSSVSKNGLNDSLFIAK